MSSYGQRIKNLRESRNITQSKLAEMINGHQAQISFIERGERGASLELACKIAQALGVSVNDLVLDGEELEPVAS